MFSMSYFWKCVLLWCTCLLVSPEIVTARQSCLRFGDCEPGFYCHTGNGLCMSCATCSVARGNLRHCEEECFTSTPTSPTPEEHVEGDPSTNQEITTPVVVVIVVAAVVLLVVVTVLAVAWHRRSKRKLTTCHQETGNVEPSQMLPPPDCAIPDESVNQRSLLQLLLPNSITES